MHARTRVRSLTVVAVVLATAATTASASRSIANEAAGAITATSNGHLTLTSGGSTEIFRVTLRGTLAASIPKVARARIGSITSCATEGEAVTSSPLFMARVRFRCDLSLPWEVNYESFLGNLPRFTGIRLIFRRPSLLGAIETLGMRAFECLGHLDLGVLLDTSREDGRGLREGSLLRIIAVRAITTPVAALEELLIECERSDTISGSLTVTPSQRLHLT
jgi:hypothetical protein